MRCLDSQKPFLGPFYFILNIFSLSRPICTHVFVVSFREKITTLYAPWLSPLSFSPYSELLWHFRGSSNLNLSAKGSPFLRLSRSSRSIISFRRRHSQHRCCHRSHRSSRSLTLNDVYRALTLCRRLEIGEQQTRFLLSPWGLCSAERTDIEQVKKHTARTFRRRDVPSTRRAEKRCMSGAGGQPKASGKPSTGTPSGDSDDRMEHAEGQEQEVRAGRWPSAGNPRIVLHSRLLKLSSLGPRVPALGQSTHICALGCGPSCSSASWHAPLPPASLHVAPHLFKTLIESGYPASFLPTSLQHRLHNQRWDLVLLPLSRGWSL